MLHKKYNVQMLPKIFSAVSMLFLLMMAIGCSKEIELTETLEVNNENPVVKAEGGAVTIDVSSNVSWKVGAIGAEWVKIEEEKGDGDGQVRLSCEENTSVHPRSVEFFIVTTRGGKYHKIKLTQLLSEPFLTLGENEIEVGSRPRSHEIKLDSNIPTEAISVEIVYEDEEGENWIRDVNVQQDALKFQTILNTLDEERVATVILSYEDTGGEDIEVWDKIAVTQMAAGNDTPPEVKDFAYVKELPAGTIDENISVVGNIVSTGVSKNLRNNTYLIQDEDSRAIAFESTESLTFGKYDKVHLLLDGAEVAKFTDSGMEYDLIKGISASNVLAREANAGFAPPRLHMDDLTEDHLLAVVTLEDVEFAMPHGGYSNFHEYYVTQSFGDYATKHYPAPIRDIQGNDMYLITNREVEYRRNTVPKGSGTITGVVVKIKDSAYGNLGEYSIRHLEESDIALDSDREKGFSKTLVEWELQPTTGFSNGTPNLPPTTGPSDATLLKDETTGFHAGNTLNGIYLIDKYRGDKPGANTIIANSAYNVNSWGTGRYWIMDNVSTSGITTSLSLTFEAVSISSTGTGGGPRDFVVEYSLDGEIWKNIAAYQLTGQIAPDQVQNVTAGLKVFSYRLPNELLDQPNIMIRLLNTNNTSVNGGSIAVPGSTSRLAHFSIKYNK